MAIIPIAPAASALLLHRLCRGLALLHLLLPFLLVLDPEPMPLLVLLCSLSEEGTQSRW